MHTDWSRWPEGHAQGKVAERPGQGQGALEVRPGAVGPPLVGPRAPGPAAPGLALSAPCPWPDCPLAWPSSHLVWSVRIVSKVRIK